MLRLSSATASLVLVLSVPLWASRYYVLLFLLFFLYLAMAQMWNLLAGYAGMVSLGQQSFVGLGGYAVAVTTVHYGAPFWVAVVMGGVVPALFALAVALPIFRMRGAYFAVSTWIVAEILIIGFSNWSYVGAGAGLFIRPAYGLSLNQLYYVAAAIGCGSTALLYLLLRTKVGLGLVALRDDEPAAESLGVGVFRSRVICFLIAAFVTGIAGGVLHAYQIFIQPFKAFGIEWTVRMIFMVIIGGIGTLEGPVIGAAILVLAHQIFAEYPSVSMLLLGGAALAVIQLAPQGIAGLIREKSDK